MIHEHVLHNDRVQGVAEARLSPGQSGLFSGWGVFTTMRVYNGRLFAYGRHWRRLERDARLLRVTPPVSAEELHGRLRRLLRSNGVTDGAARVYFVRNQVGWWYGGETLPATDLVACTSDLPATPRSASLSVRAGAVRSDHPLSGAKILSWLPNAWCRSEAERAGFYEVILLNERGEVAECASANLFCVRDGVAETPPLSSGCLDGITREVLLEAANDKGLPVREGVLRPEQLLDAEEAFITSTSRELLPVSRIEEHAFRAVPGPVTTLLREAYQERVRDLLAAEPES